MSLSWFLKRYPPQVLPESHVSAPMPKVSPPKEIEPSDQALNFARRAGLPSSPEAFAQMLEVYHASCLISRPDDRMRAITDALTNYIGAARKGWDDPAVTILFGSPNEASAFYAILATYEPKKADEDASNEAGAA